MGKTYIQIGVTALRAPDGSFLPSVPLYVEEDRLDELYPGSDREEGLENLAEVFADKYKQYMDGMRAAKRAARQKEKENG